MEVIAGEKKEANFVVMVTMGPVATNARIYSELPIADLAADIRLQATLGCIRLPDPEDGSEIFILCPATQNMVVKVTTMREFIKMQASVQAAQGGGRIHR